MDRRIALVCCFVMASLVACSKEEAPPKPIPPLPGQTPNPHSANPQGANPHGATAGGGATPMTPPKSTATPPKIDGSKLSMKNGATLELPSGWKAEGTSGMNRVAELVPPRAEGDTTDARCVITYWPGGAGAWEPNIARWAGQMSSPDGRPLSPENGKTREIALSGSTKARVFELEGTYVEAPMGGQGGAPVVTAAARMIAAMVETSGGAFFVKLTGPGKTVASATAAFDAVVKTIQMP